MFFTSYNEQMKIQSTSCLTFNRTVGWLQSQQNLLSFSQLVLQKLAVKMNYYLNADDVNMEMAKGIRNYTPICHSKFKKNQKALSTSEIHDHHDHRDIY